MNDFYNLKLIINKEQSRNRLDKILTKKLNNTIIKCKKCPRLFNFIKKISLEKRKQNINEKYWGKPVTGFGDINAKLMIIGLAPAAHGGTITGRAFTGD